MPRDTRPATIAEVAKKAGVSPATVSRVTNHRFTGDPAVAERVREVARQLGYSPNYLARSLALGRTKAVAFLVPDLANPAFQDVLSGLSRAASANGHRVLIADTAESSDDEPAAALETRGRCDALVLCAPRMPDATLSALLNDLRPVVLINRTCPGANVPSLSIDYGSGVLNLAEHLYALGHRRFGYVSGSDGSVSNVKRQRVLRQFALERDDVHVDYLPGGATIETGRNAAAGVLSSKATAVIAFNDLVAVGLIHELQDRGVQVPQEISVTGFDDIPFARYNAPALTTMAVPYRRLGAESWRRLDAVMRGEEPDYDITYQPRLEVRTSTGEPPKARLDGSLPSAPVRENLLS